MDKELSIDDLTFNLLCNKQKKSKKDNTFAFKDVVCEIDAPILDVNNQVLKIIKKKLSNTQSYDNDLDKITNSLINTCINLIKYNIEQNNIEDSN